MTRLPQFRGGKSGSVVRLRPCFNISFVSSLVISDRKREEERERERAGKGRWCRYHRPK